MKKQNGILKSELHSIEKEVSAIKASP